jgi:hypothetical protein
MGLDPLGECLNSLNPVERAHGLAFDGAEQAGHPFVTEVLEVSAVGIEVVLEMLVVSWLTYADAWVESAAREEVNGRQFLGEVKGVLPAKGRDRSTEFDPGSALRCRREYRQWGRDAVLEVTMTKPRTVIAQPLTELNYLENTLVARSGVRTVEEPDGEEPQLLQWRPRLWHPQSVTIAPS